MTGTVTSNSLRILKSFRIEQVAPIYSAKIEIDLLIQFYRFNDILTTTVRQNSKDWM